MAPRKTATSAVAKEPATSPTTSAKSGRANWDEVLHNIYQYYTKQTPQRTKLIDVFLLFLAVVGGLQFLYCVLAGNYFVLTVSLRIQTTTSNKVDFPAVSPERAFADFVVCSLILHFFCVNFIN
ncbi:oligosaccharyl transferase [Moelleriella libera RCEF 2490]|uniref:Dolichyl-diphosphooligosaccharide--protein glycosyltransferase subunit OST2 n=1 Tax=Moelleriella libera RCEF 2490 TaxID=1081109 RepID=A0A166UQ67_9HYPO|nr:oligosaccharyl transferase [Moelleriella libera RCEF 2490]